MIGRTAALADAAAAHALKNFRVVDFDADDVTYLHAHFVERGRLGNGAGKPVKDEAAAGAPTVVQAAKICVSANVSITFIATDN